MYKIGITLILVFAFSCGRVTERGMISEDDSAMHEEAGLQTTLFTSNTEFFIEYDQLVLGEESGFLVHVTQLQTYKPYQEGSITILIDGISVKADAPDRPGIFQVPFVPERAGEFEVTYTFQSGLLSESVTDHVRVESEHKDIHLHGDNDSEEEEHTEDLHRDGNGEELHEEESHHEAVVEDLEMEAHGNEEQVVGEIQFLKEQAWKIDFMVKEIGPEPFSSVISTSGEILAMPGEKKYVAAKARGIIQFSEKNLVQGSGVEKGQPLFTIRGMAMAGDNAELKFQEYKISLMKSRNEYERHKELYSGKVISEKQFIESKAKYLEDSLHYYNLAAGASAEGLKVFAPASGYIHELNVAEGQYVDMGEILVTISSNKVLLLRADVPQQFFFMLEEIESANFRPAYSNKTYSIDELNGKLLAKGSSVAENDHYMPVYFEVINDGSLLEGAFAEFYLKTKSKSNAMVVPFDAVSEEQGYHYLYVQVTGESYTKRAVSLGEHDGKRVEIISGLNPGERIVTKGVMLLKAASMVTGVASHDGHAH